MNILGSVSITPEAAKAWRETARKAIAALWAAGVTAPDIGEEEAYAQPDGTLEIRCRCGERVVHLRIPREHWTYAN